MNQGTCSGDPDECVDDDVQPGTTVCGLNDRGTLEQNCVLGQWVDGDYCDECGDVVYSGNISANEPADLTALAGVTRVEGNITITSYSGADLSALSDVRCIDGNFSVTSGDASFTSLDGAQNLVEVGNLSITNNQQLLTDLSGLDNLNRVWGYANITGNDELTSLNGLGSLRTVGEKLSIRNDPLGSLSALTSPRSASTTTASSTSAATTASHRLRAWRT